MCGVWGRAVAHSTGSAEAELGGGGVGTVRVVAFALVRNWNAGKVLAALTLSLSVT